MSAFPLAVSQPNDALRSLGRRGGAVPRVVWRVSDIRIPSEIIALLRTTPRPTLFIAADACQPIPPDFALLIEIAPDMLRTRRGAAVIERLGAIGRCRCLALVLTGVETVDLKAGWPTHRFQALRDAGVTSTLLIDCPDAATAAWAAAHSTAAGVVARFDEEDQFLAHAAFPEAAEAEAAVLATSPSTSPRDVAFRTGDPRVTAAVVDLPADLVTLAELLRAARSSLSPEERATSWERFAAAHPAPARARRVAEPMD